MLYISPEPLNADDIGEALEVARSKDVWDMFRIVMDERKKREFDPTRHMLRECRAEAEKDKATDEYTEARLKGCTDSSRRRPTCTRRSVVGHQPQS